MKMTDVDARLAELESRRVISGLSGAEQNELRDCEITLGMVDAPPRARAEAARRVERFAAERAAERAAKMATRRFISTQGGSHAKRPEEYGAARARIFERWPALEPKKSHAQIKREVDDQLRFSDGSARAIERLPGVDREYLRQERNGALRRRRRS